MSILPLKHYIRFVRLHKMARKVKTYTEGWTEKLVKDDTQTLL